MPQKSIRVDLNDPAIARDQLSREVERLETAGKRIIKIRYPKPLATELRIAEAEVGRARYGKHDAVGHHGGPYEVVIEHD